MTAFNDQQINQVLGIPDELSYFESMWGSMVECACEAGEEEFDATIARLETIVEKAYQVGREAALKQFSDRFGITWDHEGNIQSSDWNASLGEVVEVINGVGYFYFSSNDEIIDSGPFDSAKDAAVLHLHWCKEYASVFGCYSEKYTFEAASERYLRSMYY